MDNPAIVLEGVNKQYGNGRPGVAALSDVCLRVPAGEFLAVVGPSGCGKSTLLNLVAGIDTPTSGRVSVAGQELSQLSDNARSDLRLREIGFVFQSFNLLPTLSAEENVALPLEFMGVRWRAARKQAGEFLERVGIAPAAQRRRPAELSGGEQQRVATARALVTLPRVLLADEPTGNLDSQTGEGILALLRTLHARDGLTIVLVTHSAAAAACAQRIVRMRDGRVVGEQRGGADDVRDSAALSEAAQSVGATTVVASADHQPAAAGNGHARPR